MKVFKIKPDFGFQSFFSSDPNGPESSVPGPFPSGKPMLSTWTPLPMYVHKPMLERGNFAHFWGCSGKLIIDSRVREALGVILAGTCELLPLLPYKGEVFHVMNVLECVDCLDEKKTRWRIGKSTGKKIGIDEYHFAPDRFSKSTLFMLPKGAAPLTVTGLGAPESEFKTIVEREGLTGLKFEEIWSEGGPPIQAKSLLERALG